MDIRLNNISKSYNGSYVLKDLDITIPDGAITCIMGPSGAGKTTLINIIMGLIAPDSGTVTGTAGRSFAAVFQEDRLIEHYDAVKNVQLVCHKKLSQEIVREHFNQVGLTDYDDKPASALSGGMRRRVELVRAILADRNIIILDEPFKGLDEDMKLKAISYVKEHASGRTVIVITHNKDEADALGGFIVILNNIGYNKL